MKTSKRCQVDSCDLVHYARDLCRKHYQRNRVYGDTNLRIGHGLRKSSEYQSWAKMRQRCLNPNSTRYESWGGRGIKTCTRWDSFANFYKDMGEKPSSAHSLDRIDNDGDYTPENCRWATPKEQSNNRRPRRSLRMV